MLRSQQVIDDFAQKCIGCGRCVEVCPIVPRTELAGVSPKQIMEDIHLLFTAEKTGPLARMRIYSCLFCNMCIPSCPAKLNPGLVFGTAKGLLQRLGDPVPKGVAGIMDLGQMLLKGAVPAFKKRLKNPEQLITSVNGQRPGTIKTLVFASCFGLIEGTVLHTTLKIIERMDPTVKVLGGYDFCCGEFQFMGGRPDDAYDQFKKTVEAISALGPEQVLMFCPTCKMTFDHHMPSVAWSRTFITDYIARHLDALGPLNRVEERITLQDPCHFVRGERSATHSPRKILNAIPGIEIVEMENTKQSALCCGAYAITGTGRPGYEFRNSRLDQARKTGADVLALYCPGCHMTLKDEASDRGMGVESILSLLGKSLGVLPP